MANQNTFNNPKYYYNRELSWLLFNKRVLSEAMDDSLLFFERLKFLSITSSNLDEFFMVRIASLKDMVHAGYDKSDIAGMSPLKQLEKLYDKVHEFVELQYETYNNMLRGGLWANGIQIVNSFDELDKEETKYIDDYFMKQVYPVLTPMAVDSSRPFPLIKNKSLNIGAILSKKGKNKPEDFATVQVPSGLSRFTLINSKSGGIKLVLLEDIIERNISKLFLNFDVICTVPYRIMRNADLTIEEDEAADLLAEIERQIKKRQWGEAIRLEIRHDVDRSLLKILKKELNIKEKDIYRINGPIDLTFLMKIYSLDGFEDLKKKEFVPQPVSEIPENANLFECIQKEDIILHHPYQSFNPVVRFIEQAAVDPNVLAIKQTLYRVSGNSPIIKALMKAAENSKQVSVLVELKARFDEENNIVWAKMLEKAGCHVIYGLLGLKTHSKITLVVRKEQDGIKRYVHLGTGNYNDATAKLYTDLGLFTASEAVGEDATAVFNMLSGYSEPPTWNKLCLAPLWLKKRLLKLIKRETNNALDNRPARIMAKMNSLCDPDIIGALYEASVAGVKIQLLVRGICCLRVGIKGISENITVHSIVGDYLEHSRIFYFENEFSPEIFLASADWMPRNLDRRVEIMFPVENPKLKERIIHILEIQFADNVKTHILQPDGTYVKREIEDGRRISCQEKFCEEEMNNKKRNEKGHESRVFIPMSQSEHK